MNKKAQTIWLTGLPCSGKTTIANSLKLELEKKGFKVAHLDGDIVRKTLNKDLGFSESDRYENLRRVANVAQLFNENSNIVIASFVSPTREMRTMIKQIIKDIQLVYVRCRLDICEKRDIKNMYKKARTGEIKDFTGISAPFNEPINPDITIDTENNSVKECVAHILEFLK